MVVTTSLPLPPFNIVFLLGVDLTKCHLHLRMVQGDVTTMTINSSSIGAAKLDFMGSEARCLTLDSRKTRIIALAQKLEIPLKSPVPDSTVGRLSWQSSQAIQFDERPVFEPRTWDLSRKGNMS